LFSFISLQYQSDVHFSLVLTVVDLFCQNDFGLYCVFYYVYIGLLSFIQAEPDLESLASVDIYLSTPKLWGETFVAEHVYTVCGGK